MEAKTLARKSLHVDVYHSSFKQKKWTLDHKWWGKHLKWLFSLSIEALTFFVIFTCAIINKIIKELSEDLMLCSIIKQKSKGMQK